METKTLIENTAPHSVQLSTNSKGRVQIEVKVYHADPEQAAEKALEVLNDLTKKLGDRLATG